MSESACDSTPNTLDDINQKHRKEKKDLQAKIQSLKKSVTKGDRKKKKEIDDEIEKLEKDFEEKCRLELENFNKTVEKSDKTQQNKVIADDIRVNENVNTDKSEEINQMGEVKEKKQNSKSKKRREKKESEEKEREKLIALQEVENKKGPAFKELTTINEKLKVKGLKIKEMISDGNCMYYSISDQLNKKLSKSVTCQELREMTCNYMIANREEFEPYLELENLSYEEYCGKIRDPTVWGGQIELKALSDILKVLIEVVQSEGSEILIGNEKCERLIITYHRHMFGSGEHYNSTEPHAQKSNDSEDD